MSELYRLLVKNKDTRFAQFSQQLLPDLKERFRIYNKELRLQYKNNIKRTVIFDVPNETKKIENQNNKEESVNQIETPQSDAKPNHDTPFLGRTHVVLKDKNSVQASINCAHFENTKNASTEEILNNPAVSKNQSIEFAKTLLKISEPRRAIQSETNFVKNEFEKTFLGDKKSFFNEQRNENIKDASERPGKAPSESVEFLQERSTDKTTFLSTNKIETTLTSNLFKHVLIEDDKSPEFKEEDSAKVIVEKLNELQGAQNLSDDAQRSNNVKLIERKKINKYINNEWEKAFHGGCVKFDDELTKNNVKELLSFNAVETKTSTSKYIDKRVGMIRGKKLELNILKRTNEELSLNFDKKTKRKLKDYGNFEINGIVDGIDTKNSCILEIKTRNSKNVNYYMPTESDQLQGLAYMDIFNCKDCLFAICDAHGQLYFNFFKLDEEEFNFRIKDKLDSLVNDYIRNITERTFASLIIEANLKDFLHDA
jgi:hypothetical protein